MHLTVKVMVNVNKPQQAALFVVHDCSEYIALHVITPKLYSLPQSRVFQFYVVAPVPHEGNATFYHTSIPPLKIMTHHSSSSTKKPHKLIQFTFNFAFIILS